MMSTKQEVESQVFSEWQLCVLELDCRTVEEGPRARPANESSFAALKHAIIDRIKQRTGGRIQSLRVELDDDRVVIHGRVECFHHKQLALQGVLDALRFGNKVCIELNVEVERSDGR
jgi:hypothetical protein